jgi:hypothetical protein
MTTMDDFTELGDDAARALHWENTGKPKWRQAEIREQGRQAVRQAQSQADHDALWADFPTAPR